jgi:hypothetical protein
MITFSVMNSTFHVLYCTVLYCTVLYCTVLYCTVLYCTVLSLYRTVSEDLIKMRTKEKYMNNQYASLCAEYEQVRINPLPDIMIISS